MSTCANSGIRQMILLVGCILATGSAAYEPLPTNLPVPDEAKDVRHVTFNEGNAFQTDYKLYPQFPKNPALEHYAKALNAPWKSCRWADEWQHFLDGRKSPAVTVHQSLHVWVNEKERRSLALSVRYLSSDKCAEDRPDNDEHHVAIVEYLDVDIPQMIELLKLDCSAQPAKGATRDSSVAK